MNYEYDYLFYIGRFQPFHLGHQQVVELALKKTANLIILVGSSNLHISTANPWTFEQRKDMILKSCHHLTSLYQTLAVEPLNDYMYNDIQWFTECRKTIEKIVPPGKRYGIIAFNKDESTYYIKYFKNMEVVEVPTQFGTLNATQIRDQYFQDAPMISEFIPDEIRSDMKKFAFSDEFKWLLNEYKYIRGYKKMWEAAPFPPVFVTADNVVMQSDLILLVTRGDAPYKGALALPGGFINPNECVIDSAVRELREETEISDEKGIIPPGMLKSFITKSEVFDNPGRSQRGRTITHAYLFDLPKREKMYTVIGSDDAAYAQWYELSDLKVNMFMEDHAFIIQKMLGITMD